MHTTGVVNLNETSYDTYFIYSTNLPFTWLEVLNIYDGLKDGVDLHDCIDWVDIAVTTYLCSSFSDDTV